MTEAIDGATLALYDSAISELLERGYDDSELRESYSGRGMFGKTCPAIVTNAPPVVVGAAFAMACLTQEIEAETKPADMLQRVEVLIALMLPKRIDSMGKDCFVYY